MPPEYRQLVDSLRELGASAESARGEYERTDVVGVSPDGSVRVTVRAGRIADVVISPGALDHDNVYVAAQVLAALRQAEGEGAELLAKHTRPMLGSMEAMRAQFG